MTNTEQTTRITLQLPTHIFDELDGWADRKLEMSGQRFLELLAQVFVGHSGLRKFVEEAIDEAVDEAPDETKEEVVTEFIEQLFFNREDDEDYD